MENNKDLFELMTKMYSEMQQGFKNVDTRLTNVEDKVTNIENRVTNIENRVTNIENRVTVIEEDHGKKLTALFDGYTQNTNMLETIKEEVSKHEEVILKRVK